MAQSTKDNFLQSYWNDLNLPCTTRGSSKVDIEPEINKAERLRKMQKFLEKMKQRFDVSKFSSATKNFRDQVFIRKVEVFWSTLCFEVWKWHSSTLSFLLLLRIIEKL